MVGGGGKGSSEGRRIALRSIRIVAVESFPQRYIPSIAVALESGMAITEDKQWTKRSSMFHMNTVAVAMRM
jgi:hypothetical protein